MAKKVYKVEAFEGGINQKANPRDIEDNQFEELFNADVSKKGRITLPGNALSVYKTINALGGEESTGDNPNIITNENSGLTSGYGLFSFAHDYNMKGLGSNENYPTTKPDSLETDFICINDGAAIDIWDSSHSDDVSVIISKAIWIEEAIKLGPTLRTQKLGKIKPTYYKADNGLRVCDGSFGYHQESSMKITNDPLSVTDTALTTNSMWATSDVGSYIHVNSEIMLITVFTSLTAVTVKRGQFGTKAQQHAQDSTFKIINVPKILTHINRPLLEKAEGASGANTHINKWVEEIQFPEPPADDALTVYDDGEILGLTSLGVLRDSIHHPSSPEKVFFSCNEAFSPITQNEDITFSTTVAVATESGSSNEPILVLTLSVDVVAAGFAIGKALVIQNAGETTAAGSILNGVHEIVGFGDNVYKVKIANEAPAGGYTGDGNEVVRLEETVMSEDLKNKYIFGMSYLYNGGSDVLQESDIRVGYKKTPLIAHNHVYFLRVYDKWHTDKSNDYTATENDLDIDSTTVGGWKWKTNSANATDTGDLAYVEASSLVEGDTYDVHVKIRKFSGTGSITIRLGWDGAIDDDDETSASTVGTKKTLTNSDGVGIYLFKLKVSEGASLNNTIVLSAADTSSLDVEVSEVQVWKAETIMTSTNAVDFRPYFSAGKSQFSFLCNNSRSGSTQNNSWNERIEGFRIYMKQVDFIGGGLTEDWLLFMDVNLKDGTYIAHAKDGDKELLQLANPASTADDWNATSTDADINSLVTSNVLGDIFKEIPLLSYESENGYPAGTNLAAMYKTSAIVNRKVYIGNIKIGNRTFPDRMIKADADKFDSFPSDGTHYIDVAASDGDSIVKLESFGDSLIQFKKRTAYLLKIGATSEDLEDTWFNAGILSPSQVVKTKDGIVWVNNSGLFYYNGEKLQHISDDRFTSDSWAINENEDTPVLLGYDEKSSKVIIQTLNTSATDSGGFIYDMTTGAISQCQKLFNWFVTIESIPGEDSGIGPVKYINKTDSGDDQTAGSGSAPIGPSGKILDVDEILGG